MQLDNNTLYINNSHSDSREGCPNFCQKARVKIQDAKASILAEFAGTRAAHRHLLRLALNEAEALAWQNPYPHLLFPTLALEKVQQVAVWHARQESLRQTGSLLALAA
jgi:hypothetical protein